MATCKNSLHFVSKIQTDLANTVVAGSTSGTVTTSMPFQGATFKKVIIYLNNLTGTALVPFATAFTNTPAWILGNANLSSSNIVSISNSNITLTGTGTSGYITLEGF